MSKLLSIYLNSILLAGLLTSLVLAQPAAVPQPAAPAKPAGEQPIREIFVPFDDLQVILESDKNRVFLTREEYEELLATVQAKAVKSGPVSVVLLSAAYTGRIDDGRAQLTGKVELEVINEGWHVIPLALGNLGVKSATLDGKPASLARDSRGQVRLFVNGQGKHQLELQLTAAVPAAAALQTLQVRLPIAAAATLDLSVAGNVEVKGGAAVVKRTYDEKANRTQLALLLDRGPMAIVMSLNNKQAREQRLVVARTVQVDEITLGYERLHVNVSHRILHDPVDRFRFAVPAGFEVTSVTSQRLSRWEVKPDDKGRQILEAVLSEATTEPTLITISANRSPELGQDWLASLQKWKLPRLQPLDVAGEVAVVGLLVEKRLEPQELTTKQLLPIDSPILTQAMPESIFRAEPGAPEVGIVATYYVPAYIDATQYDLSANFVRPESGLVVSTSLLLSLSDQGHELRGGFIVSPLAEDLFQVRLKVPLGWRVQEVLGDNNQPLAIERYELADGSTRLLVTLPARIAAGKKGKIIVRASSNPAGWLADWKEQAVTFPQLEIERATRETGAIAVQTGDDLAVQPTELSGLVPLLENEKEAQGLAGVVTSAAYRFETRPFAAKFSVERKQPSLAAEVFSFLQVLPDAIKCHYELAYQVREARTRKLVFSLPAATPKEITIAGLDGVLVKEFRSTEDGDRRRWVVQLADRLSGEIRLTVDFQQPLTEKELTGVPLPLAQAEDVEYQSAFASLEGSPDLEVTPTTANRTVDEAELYQARYLLDQPAAATDKRLIGAYGYAGREGSIKVDILRRQQHPLPSAIVQRADLLTQISASGLTQTAVSYQLTTKASLLEVVLPGDSRLWTMLVDGQPTKPQKEKNTLLVSLPPREDLALRRLQIIYETSGWPLSLSANVNAYAPKLFLRGGGDEAAREVPQADVQWQLILPPGYALRTSSGTVSPVKKPRQPIAVLQLAAAIYELGGGVGRRHPMNELGELAESIDAIRIVDSSQSMAKVESFSRKQAGERAPRADFDGHRYGENATPQPLAPAAMDPFAAPQTAKSEPQRPTAEAPPPPVMVPALAPPPDAKPADPAMPASGNTQPLDPGPQQAFDVGPQQPLDPGVAISGKFAALEGVSSLPIEFNNRRKTPPEVFESFGVDPQLKVTLVDTTRIDYAALGVGLLVFLMGVALTHRPAKQQAAYVVVFLLISSLPVLLTSALDDVGLVFDYAFYAACALIPYFLIASVCLSLWRMIVARLPAGCCRPEEAPVQQIAGTGTIITPLLIFFALLLFANEAPAVEPMPEAVKLADVKDLFHLLDPGGPVTVPADAVIIPYDANSEDGLKNAKKVLIPYAKFIELWNRAHPDKPKETKPAPIEFAVLAADYQATLAATDELVVTGKLTIDVLSDKAVAIPLPFSGGVLVKATLDGQPARLQVVAPQAPQQQLANPAPNAPDAASGGVIVLHTEGVGRKQVEISFRLGLTRRGGWRQVAASLPLGGSNQLTLTVPDAATEVRIAGTPDKDNFETKAASEKIETTLVGAGSGRLDLQWRPKVAIGQIDQSLTSTSAGVLDVREDALRLTWVAQLGFGRGTRDQFEFSLPKDYAIEQVLSENLRGWQVKPDAARQLVEVTLLKPATGSEKITLVISKRGRIGTGEFATFDAPAIFVSGAALQQGEIMIRRSPRLELRTETTTGISRADADGQVAAAMQTADSEDPSILNLRPYQSYRFVASGGGDKFTLRLSAAETQVTTSAEVRSILRVADTETTLNVGVKIIPQGQPVYRVDVLLPAGFELDEVYRDEQWSVVPDAASGRNKLSLQLLDGLEQEFTLAFLGRLGKREKWEEIAAPLITVLNVERQQGELVVATDPDIDVLATNLKNAETEPLQQAHTWLKVDQQNKVRVALKYRVTDYAATFKLTRKTPRVTVRTLSNVKVTRRAIEETIVLDYSIAQAGIREVQFLLPDSLKTARIRVAPEASLLQRKKIEPATNGGQPVPGWLLVTLSLQDHVNDSLGVIVEHDRLLTDKPQDVAIPRSLTGTTSQRFVVIENVGRDEVVEVKRAGLEPISRQQQVFQEVVQLVNDQTGGNAVVHAYVGIGDQTPSLSFKTQANEQVQTAKARIEFARTTLVVDEAGGYRARVIFQVNNSTEQYLDIVLPAGARLWTAMVKGQPVKPVEHPTPIAGKMRIPLVKSPAGSGDYSVEIKYGGSLGRLQTLKPISFPLIRTEGINVEQSQVELYLPENYSWPQFGGTMSHVKSEEELEEGLQSYFQKKVSEAKLALQSDDLNTKLRAQANISGLMQSWQFNTANRSLNNLKQLGVENYNDLQLAQNEATAQVQEQLEGPNLSDNRGNINEAWSKKSVTRSKNVVAQLGNNFDAPGKDDTVPQANTGKGKGDLAYNPQFLKGNKLYTEESNEKVIQDEQKKFIENQLELAKTPAGTKPSAAPPAQPQPQGRVTRGGKQQQAIQDLEGDRAGLAKELRDFGDQTEQRDRGGRPGEGQAGQGSYGRLPQIPGGGPGQMQGGRGPGQGMGGGGRGSGQGMGRRPEEEVEKSSDQSRQRDNAFRYQQKLEQEQQQGQSQQLFNQQPNQRAAQPASPFDNDGPSFSLGLTPSGPLAANAPATGGFDANAPGFAAPGVGAAAGPSPTGLASLDVAIVPRGKPFLFTMPRGDIEITARPASRDLLHRLTNLGIIAALIALGIITYRICRQLPVRQATGTMAFAILLILLGVISWIANVLPYIGGVLLLVGIALLVLRLIYRRNAAQPVA